MFKGRFTKDGGLSFSDYTKNELKLYMKKNPDMPFELTPLLPESRKQRNWFEGAICPLIAFYQEGLNHRNWRDVQKVHEWIKMEFNSEIVYIKGEAVKIPQSTKGKLNKGVLENVVEWLNDNYQPPREALDTKAYENWRDTIYPYGGPETYIDYLLDKNVL